MEATSNSFLGLQVKQLVLDFPFTLIILPIKNYTNKKVSNFVSLAKVIFVLNKLILFYRTYPSEMM